MGVANWTWQGRITDEKLLAAVAVDEDGRVKVAIEWDDDPPETDADMMCVERMALEAALVALLREKS